MGQTLHEIPDSLVEWIQKQHIFWVASAPLSAEGHVNISTKGVDGTFHVVNSRKVWYEDLSGSGVETIAHIRENGRVTILFNAFDGPPRILRLYGRGSVYEIGTPEYDSLLPVGKRRPGSRSAIILDVFRVSTTCGYAVPFYEFVSHRTQLIEWAAKKEAIDREGGPALKGMKSWWASENSKSIDGLPGLSVTSYGSKKLIQQSKYAQQQQQFQQQQNDAIANGNGHMKGHPEVITRTDPVYLFAAFIFGVMMTLVCGRLV